MLLAWTIIACACGGIAYSIAKQDFHAFPEGLTYAFPGLLFLGALPVGVTLLLASPATAGAPHVETAIDWSMLLMLVGLTWTYVIAMTLIGFLPATLLFQTSVLRFIFNRRGWRWLTVLPLAATCLFSVFFKALLAVPLPRGIGIFYVFNTLFI